MKSELFAKLYADFHSTFHGEKSLQELLKIAFLSGVEFERNNNGAKNDSDRWAMANQPSLFERASNDKRI